MIFYWNDNIYDMLYHMITTYLFYIIFFLGGIGVAMLQRRIMRNMKIRAKQPLSAGHKNIDLKGRLLRGSIALVCVVYGVWFDSNIAMLGAGYAAYETVATWCGFYALIGRNTCPL